MTIKPKTEAFPKTNLGDVGVKKLALFGPEATFPQKVFYLEECQRKIQEYQRCGLWDSPIFDRTLQNGDFESRQREC